jgi:hypothetical protein
MLQGYLSQEWTAVAYNTLSGNDMKSDTTISWSKQIVNCLWTSYAFNMWEHRCKLLAEDKEGLKFTKVDNAIRHLYTKKDLFLNVNKGLFALPLAWILATSTSTKHAHLLGMQAAKIRWEESTDTSTPLENIINPTHRQTTQAKTNKHRKQEKAQRKKEVRRQRKHNKNKT